MSLFNLISANLNCLDIWMLTIFQTLIKLDLKWYIYIFTYASATIPCKSIKQIVVVIISNHLEILWIHEASHECVWLKLMIQHTHESCGLSFIKYNVTKLYKDNVACILQIKGGFVKGNKTK